jgi:uncharacterized protein
MPLRELAPVGAPCWIELFTSNADITRQFYCELFGWTWENPGDEFGGYFNFYKDGHQVSGGMTNDGSAGAPDGWSVYLAVDRIDAVAVATPANGGVVMMPPMQVMELGSMAILGDPSGAAIGAWQPNLHKGFVIYGEPGSPSWFELHTNNYDAAVSYYREVFAWPVSVMSDTVDFRYSTYGEGDSALAGIMDASKMLPEGAPSHWEIYFEVASTDASCVQVQSLGGSIIEPGETTPYGRMALVADPMGNRFRLRQTQGL